MNTPQSFAQLHAKATPGPYKLVVVELWEGEPISHAVAGKDGEQICSNESYYPQAVHLADQELICRLLNFAEAGGETLIRELVDDESGGALPPGKRLYAWAERLSAILNGETAP